MHKRSPIENIFINENFINLINSFNHFLSLKIGASVHQRTFGKDH